MNNTSALLDALIGDLHCEALVLADEARAGLARIALTASDRAPKNEVALACAGMRVVARMVDGLAWIESRRIRETAGNDPISTKYHRLDRSLALRPCPPGPRGDTTGVGDVIAASKAFHRRLQRLDSRAAATPQVAGARALQRRLAAASLTAPG
jgi:hypothetical protein